MHGNYVGHWLTICAQIHLSLFKTILFAHDLELMCLLPQAELNFQTFKFYYASIDLVLFCFDHTHILLCTSTYDDLNMGSANCVCLRMAKFVGGASLGLGLQNLTLGVQLQPQKYTKCRP